MNVWWRRGVERKEKGLNEIQEGNNVEDRGEGREEGRVLVKGMGQG